MQVPKVPPRRKPFVCITNGVLPAATGSVAARHTVIEGAPLLLALPQQDEENAEGVEVTLPLPTPPQYDEEEVERVCKISETNHH